MCSSLPPADHTVTRRGQQHRRQTDEQLHEAHERLRLAAEISGIGTWERDPVTGQGRWDAMMRRHFGLAPDAATPTRADMLAMIHLQDRARVEAAWQQISEAGESREYEFRVIHPHGELRHLLARGRMLRDLDGRPVREIGTTIDVSEARRAELERDDLALRVQLVADTVGLGIWDWDLLAETSVWNDQTYAMFGRTREQFRDLLWLDIVHPDDVPAARAALQSARAAGSTFDIEYRVVWPDRTVRWIATRGRVVRDVLGHAVRMLGVNLDVTRQHETAARLRDLVERLQMTTAATGIGLWTVDLRDDKVEWDEQMRRLYDCADENDADPRRIGMERIHPGEREAVTTATAAAVRQGTPLDIDVHIVRRDGEVRTLAHRAQIQHDEHGAPLRQLGVCWDITERRQAEESRREREAAERASRAKSDFLSRVSHELRTPLNAILGFAQILGMDHAEPLSARQQERLQQIQAAGRHLLALINDVLDLSRIEAGAEKLSLQPTPLLPVLEACVALTAAQATAQGVTVHGPMIAAEPPQVWADATRLKQIVLNLLSNAIKYNRQGGQVSIVIEAPRTGVMAIRFIDTGLGMSETQIGQLFQPFNRLGRESQPIPGAGIGLTISQRLAEQMGAAISALSEPGAGSEFSLQLRLVDEADETAATSAAEPELGAKPRSDVLGRVLYVEDVESARSLVEGLMSMRPGVKLLLAEDAASALRLAAENPLDLVLIDVNLPDMNGLQLLERLRAMPQLRDLPFVAVSANALKHQIDQAIAAGFDDYWTKPLQAQRFLRGIDGLLARCHTAGNA